MTRVARPPTRTAVDHQIPGCRAGNVGHIPQLDMLRHAYGGDQAFTTA